MGCRELIESLRASCEAKVGTIHAGVEHEAEKILTDTRRRIEDMRAGQERRTEELSTGLFAGLAAEAKNRTRQMILDAEQKLSVRLYALARSALQSLRNVGYEDMFRSFVSELPPAEWRTVHVNPADTVLAKESFPGAEIEPDAGISGGLIAETAERRLRVDNTFERRLERAWESMLPEIMKEIKEFSANANNQAPGSR